MPFLSPVVAALPDAIFYGGNQFTAGELLRIGIPENLPLVVLLELFVWSMWPAKGGEAASVEYAVQVLGVTDAIVCGNSHWGATGGLLEGRQPADLPAVRSWLTYAEAARRIIDENYPHVTDCARRSTTTVEENALVQLEDLHARPSVAAAIGRKQVALLGWVCEFETGKVFPYGPGYQQFSPIEAFV